MADIVSLIDIAIRWEEAVRNVALRYIDAPKTSSRMEFFIIQLSGVRLRVLRDAVVRN